MSVSPQKRITQYDSEEIEPSIGCIASAMKIIGNKWTALLLRDLATGPKRFTELEKSVDGINPRILSQRLDELEMHGIITKQTYRQMPQRIEYTLTPKGQDLIPILRQMASWGAKYPMDEQFRTT